jgi:GTP cyclohydrolase I
MEAALKHFLVAAGLDPARHADLAQTAELTARAWAEEFLDGYRTDPRAILAARIKAPRGRGRELVVLADLDYQGVCPHHLLPYGGVAHVAYLPGAHVVGFGQIVKLLDCLSHRLVLQEHLARQIADALTDELGARGAGVLLEAEQACMALRGGRRRGSRAYAEAFTGALASDAELRERFVSAARRG